MNYHEDSDCEMELLKIGGSYHNDTKWWFVCHWVDGSTTPQFIEDFMAYNYEYIINNYLTDLLEEGFEQKANSIIQAIEELNKSKTDYLGDTNDEWYDILNQK